MGKFFWCIGKPQSAESFTVFMKEHLLTYIVTPSATCGNDASQHNCPFAFQASIDSAGKVLHIWLSREQTVMPGLYKHIKNTSADSLALHCNLFSQINLDYSGAFRINHIESTTPHFSLATTATDGTANRATTMHKHFRSDLTWNGAFALDNSRHSHRFT